MRTVSPLMTLLLVFHWLATVVFFAMGDQYLFLLFFATGVIMLLMVVSKSMSQRRAAASKDTDIQAGHDAPPSV